MIKQRGPFRALLIVEMFLCGGVATASATGGTIPDANVVRWVEKTVAERQAPAEDKRFDEIAWVTDIRTAIHLGKEYNRPIFLLTVDGRINTGRCTGLSQPALMASSGCRMSSIPAARTRNRWMPKSSAC